MEQQYCRFYSKDQISQSYDYKGHHLCDVSRKMVMNQQFWQSSFFIFFVWNISYQKLWNLCPPTGEMGKLWANRRLYFCSRWKCLNLSNCRKFIFFSDSFRIAAYPPIHPNQLSKDHFYCLFCWNVQKKVVSSYKKIYQSLVPNVGNIFQCFLLFFFVRWCGLWRM